MDESKIRTELSQTLFRFGLDWIHPPDMAQYYESHRLDLICYNPAPGGSVLVEVKQIHMKNGPRAGHNGSLLFSAIRDPQRRTLDRWCYVRSGLGYLAIGTIENTLKIKRRLWVIEWPEWVGVEHELFSQGHKSIFVHSPSERGIENLFDGDELIWNEGDSKCRWIIPENHSLRRKIKVFPHDRENEWVDISLRFEKEKKDGSI